MTKNHIFNEIYEKYKNLVLKVAYRYSEDFDAAEDIMQETFLALYRDMDDKEYSNIQSWLYTTAKHSALNYKKKSEREVSYITKDPETEEESLIVEPSRESTEEEYMEEVAEEGRVQLHERVFAGLMETNPRWHEAVMLVCCLQIPQAEAAEKMNISTEAFYVMLHRARNWIKKKYGVEYDELNRL